MEFKEIVEIAKKEMEGYDLIGCTDIGDKFAFDFTEKDSDLIPPGLPVICVGKVDGEVSYMTIPPISNLDILQKGKVIKI